MSLLQRRTRTVLLSISLILRYSDVLLMIAEAENEYNGAPTPLAEECLKEVRDRAGISDLTGQITSGEDFLTIIKR